jgi:signal transduction histidine kinase
VKVRTRLVLAFAYILVTIIIAFGVPLAVTLQARARSEFETNLLVTAQTLAASIGGEAVGDPQTFKLQRTVNGVVDQLTPDARIIVVDGLGRLIADSDGTTYLGEVYATPRRPEIVRALNKQPNVDERFSTTNQEELVVAASPIFDEACAATRTRGNAPFCASTDGVAGAVRISESLNDVNRSVRSSTIRLVVVGAAALLAGLILAYGIARSLARPLARLAATARRLGRGDLGARAGDVGGAEEIKEVAHSFDEMAGRLERSVQAQREFVANASHQLRTPLTGIKLRIESAIRDAPDEEHRRDLNAADREVNRLSQIVDRLLVLSRQIEAGEGAPVEVDDAATRAIERWHGRAERAGATLTLEGGGGAAQANPHDLDQVLDNLLENAIAYAPGPIAIGTGRRDDGVFVEVRDRGPGIPDEELGRVTDRFYRGKESRAEGSGLGLAIARELTEKWGGVTTVSLREHGGLRVEILLRVAAVDGDAQAHPPTDDGGGNQMTAEDRHAR